MGLDLNASSLDRIRRNWQQIAKGAITSTLTVAAPITKTTAAIGLAFLTSTGLGLTSNALAVLFADQSIVGSSTGIKANLMSTGGLQTTASGIGISTALATTAPLAGGGNVSTGLTLSMSQASSTANGWLSSTDWTAFHTNAGGSGLPTSTLLNTTGPLAGGGNLSTSGGLTLSLPQATSAANGYLTSTDWTTFNGKQAAGNYLSTNQTLSAAAPITGGGTISTGLTIGVTDFVASGASHARGTVPDPGSTAGTTHFLREDATWAVPSGGSAVIAGDNSISTGTSTGSTTVIVHDDPSGGLQTLSTGLGVLLDDHAPTSYLQWYSSTFAQGTVLASTGGGTTWLVTSTLFNPAGPGSTAASTAIDIKSTNPAGVETAESEAFFTNASAVYLPVLALPSLYQVSIYAAAPPGATSANMVGIYAMLTSTTGYGTGGVLALFLQSSVQVYDLHTSTGPLLGSTTYVSTAGFRTYAVVVNTAASTVAVTVDGSTILTLTKNTDLTNTVPGFFLGKNAVAGNNFGIQQLNVLGLNYLYSGLKLDGTNGLEVLLANSSLSVSSSGLSVTPGYNVPSVLKADTASINSTSFGTIPTAQYSFPAGYFTSGKTVRVTWLGEIDTGTTASGVSFQGLIGGLGIQPTGTATLSLTASSTYFFEAVLTATCRTAGLGEVVATFSVFMNKQSSTTPLGPFIAWQTSGVGGFDTTVAAAAALQFKSASSTTSAFVHQFFVEELN